MTYVEGLRVSKLFSASLGGLSLAGRLSGGYLLSGLGLLGGFLGGSLGSRLSS